jgi:hypothetical protein
MKEKFQFRQLRDWKLQISLVASSTTIHLSTFPHKPFQTKTTETVHNVGTLSKSHESAVFTEQPTKREDSAHFSYSCQWILRSSEMEFYEYRERSATAITG